MNEVDLGSAQRLYVLTGGPGSGKSTLLSALRMEGFHVIPESGRAIIQAEVAASGTALPWADQGAFAARMFECDVTAWRGALGSQQPVFFDRGIPDVIGYLRLCGLPIPVGFERTAQSSRYHSTVFVAPPWPEIFVQDAERKQTLKKAEATWQMMVDIYEELHYTLVHLPKVTTKERVRFILERIEDD